MKNIVFITILRGALMLLALPVFGQNPVRNLDSIPAYPKDSFLPDCDKRTKSFRYFAGGQWKYRVNAGKAYAYVLDRTGESPNISPEDAIESVEEAMNNPLVTNIPGFIGGIFEDGNDWCIALTDTLKVFDGRLWFRINSRWAVYLRDGCANIALVFDPARSEKKEAKPCDPVVIEKVRIEYRDTGKVQCCTTIVQNQCCGVLKLKWDLFYPMFGSRSTYSSDLWKETVYLGGGYRHHWRDTTQQFSTYAGAEIAVMLRKLVTCPDGSCLNFTDQNFVKPAARFEIFGGREWGIDKFRFFAEARYALIQPNVRPADTKPDRVLLPKRSGFTIRGGVRWNPVKNIELQGAVEYDPMVKQMGGDVRVALMFDSRDKAERTKVRKERAAKQFKRNEQQRIKQEKVQFTADSSAVAHFFEHNLDTIIINNDALRLDSVYADPTPVSFLGYCIAPLPFTEQAKGVKMNKARVEVLKLQQEHNSLRLQMKNTPSKWKNFEHNVKKLKKAEKKLAKREKKIGIKNTEWRRL